MIIKEFQSSGSLLDYIDGKQTKSDIYKLVFRPQINDKAAKTLYKIWRNENNIVSANILKKPYDFSIEDVNVLEREGLIQFHRDQMHVTQKGASVLRVMILGDNRSSFEDNGDILDYRTAELNTKNFKKSSTKVATKASVRPFNLLKSWV